MGLLLWLSLLQRNSVLVIKPERERRLEARLGSRYRRFGSIECPSQQVRIQEHIHI